ncbi:tetrahydrofolate dehydrogenase/cyclohydrolase catalytic domain-containing protein [Trueperella sp. LYQ143]|uniref:tetrahydrofolate dehydrogenase/cyclohydrolase catalytic domain-containing protein n=1 Tax=Trueperella sp. LYQ143 TaxID=3391059 RepID=UPI003983B905
MTARILDGRREAYVVKEELRAQVRGLQQLGCHPGLGTILVGDDPASHVYVRGKHRDCADVGIESLRIDLPVQARVADILAAVRDLNNAPECTGFIVQLPLPDPGQTRRILEAIDPHKDADGLHPMNLGRLASTAAGALPPILPCTPRAIVELGRRGGVQFDRAHVCVIGQGQTVGRPLSLLLTHEQVNATVTSCHIGTWNLAEHTRSADIIVAAAGAAHLLRAAMVRAGAAVFDVGVTRIAADCAVGTPSRIVGDVHPEVAEVAGYISPNPGGVGPMTRAMLLANVVDLARNNISDRR